MVHSRSSLPVAVALTLRKLFGLKFLYDADSVLSEEYVDVGHLSRESRGFKLMARSEAAARRHADHMIVLTESLRNRLLPEVDAPIDVIPCCVDTGRFVRSEGERAKRRSEMGVSGGQQVLVYVGKPGSWYLIDETFEFFRAFSAVRPGAKLLVVTQAEREVFDVTAERLGIIRTDYFVRSSSPEEVPNWLSVADAGLSLIRQVDSKSGSSPVKFAEYLSCGLPVVTTDRIGDCTAIVRSDEVGAVVDVPDRPGLAASAAELAELLDAVEPKALAERCRKTAETHFHMQTVGVKKYREIYERLLGQARGPLHD